MWCVVRNVCRRSRRVDHCLERSRRRGIGWVKELKRAGISGLPVDVEAADLGLFDLFLL